MRVDPVTFEVVNNALVGVADQMAATILRTSYSTVIREMLDYSTAVFDLDGRIIAQSCRIPIHLNSMSRSLRTTLDESIPIGEWEEGDIVVTNDPYKGGQHLPDIQTFLPVFHERNARRHLRHAGTPSRRRRHAPRELRRRGGGRSTRRGCASRRSSSSSEESSTNGCSTSSAATSVCPTSPSGISAPRPRRWRSGETA